MHTTFRMLAGDYAVVRAAPGAPLDWVDWSAPLVSVTRTAQELSIVCASSAVPADAHAERGWRALGLDGPIAFGITGVVARFSTALAAAGVGVFVISTFDTDLLLVKESELAAAVTALRAAGYTVA